MRANYIIAMLALSGFAPSISASVSHNIFQNPYLGLEASQIRQGFKNGYGKSVFPNSAQNYNAFVGVNIKKNIGIEAGYEWQPTKGSDRVLLAGQQLPGQDPLTGAQFEGIHSSYKATHPYLGLFVQCNSNLSLGRGKVQFQALIGGSLSKVKASVQRIVTDGGVVSPTLLYGFSKSRVVPIVRLSAVSSLSSNLGLRLSVNYRNMAGFNITSNIPSGATIPLVIKMRNAFGIGIGLKYTL